MTRASRVTAVAACLIAAAALSVGLRAAGAQVVNAYTIIEKQLGYAVTIREQITRPGDTTTVTRLSLSDPGRVQRIVTNQSGSNCFLCHDDQCSTSTGILLGGNGGLYEEDIRDDLDLPTLELWFVCAGAVGNIYLEERSVQ